MHTVHITNYTVQYCTLARFGDCEASKSVGKLDGVGALGAALGERGNVYLYSASAIVPNNTHI